MNRALNFRRSIGQDQGVARLLPFTCCGFLSPVRLVIFKPVYLHFKERLDFGFRLCVVSSLLRLIEDYG
jgi:hypothetical protein